MRRPAGSAGWRGGAAASGVYRDAEQAHGDPLTGRQEHVELPGIGGGCHLAGHREELVGGVAHRRNDHDNLMARLLRSNGPTGGAVNLGGVGNAATAEFLND